METVLHGLCHTCNKRDLGLIDIRNSSENKCLQDMLEYCTQTKLNPCSIFPQYICYNCVRCLEISYKFLKQYHLAESQFALIENQSEKRRRNLSEHSHDYDYDNSTKRMENNYNVTNHGDQLMDSSTGSIYNTDDKHKLEIVEMDTSTMNVKTNLLNVGLIETCALCQKQFFTKAALRLHMTLSHKIKFELKKFE